MTEPTNRDAPDRGARYFRADLQVHTPADKRWPGTVPSDADGRAELAVEYLKAAKQRGIDLVGITEHHDVSWIDELRHAAARLRMLLLPGFEVESQEGIHVLCLFDPKTKVTRLEDALALLGLPRSKREASKITEIRSNLSLPDLVSKIQVECGGICIAAHVTSNKGILTALEGGARADCWKAEELLAAQIPCAVSDIPHEGTRRILQNGDDQFRRQRHLAYVLTSDARSPETIGAQSVWLKMQRPSVEGLRQAFLDPESRIAFEDPHASRATGEILSVGWEGGFLDGQVVGLNSELTCLIGSKGTGKSTVIESLRWVFGIDQPESSDVRDLLANALRAGSKVTVRIRTRAPVHEHTVERTMPHGPIVRDSLGGVLSEVNPTDLLGLQVFSQKQLYDTAQSISARLELIETFAGDSLADIRASERRVLAELSTSARGIRDDLSKIEEWEVQLSELPALEQWRKRFADAGFEERLRERRALDQESMRLDALDKALLARVRGADRLRDETPPPSVTQVLDDWPNVDLLREAEAIATEATNNFAVKLDALHDDLRESRERLAVLRASWEARRAGRQADFDAALRELQASMPEVDPERYLDVERRIEALVPLKEELVRARDRLDHLWAGRRQALADLSEIRGQKYRARDAAAQRLTVATNKDVEVQVHYQADRSAVLEVLKRRKTGVRAAALETMVASPDFTPAGFSQRVRERSLSGKYGLPDGQAALLERELTEEDLLSLEVAEMHDEVTVALDVGSPDNRSYRPLNQLSPGQKSTAVLLLTLQSGTDPLLIDQPEDDLDNRFVYDDVVQRLRSAKRCRQVLVATHNANIPVLGDAEQIVVLEATSNEPPRGAVAAHGPIDDDAVRIAAEQILEGGEQAFQRRREKYGW